MNQGEIPPELDKREVPFEGPSRRFARTRKLIRHVRRKREKPPPVTAITVFVLIYFVGGLGVRYFDSGSLLVAWLATGPLAVTIYLTYEGRGSLLNPYTLFFSTILVAGVATHFLVR
jgi:H+/Cl- antiporter ClcA